MQSSLSLKGALSTKVIRAPGPGLLYKLRNLGRSVVFGWVKHQIAKFFRIAHLTGTLKAILIRADGSVVNYGLISTRLVTTAFVNFMVDQLQADTTEWGDFNFHDSGVGTTPAAVGDTDIETTDAEARVAGTQVEGATAEIYRSVGTIAYTTTLAITEHGIFSIITGGTMMDHHIFSAINVSNGDSIQFTYELTVSDGG